MRKKLIRLNESQLQKLITKSVKSVLNEGYYGIDDIQYIVSGNNELASYAGKVVNYDDFDTYVYNMAAKNGVNIQDSNAFKDFCLKNKKSLLSYIKKYGTSMNSYGHPEEDEDDYGFSAEDEKREREDEEYIESNDYIIDLMINGNWSHVYERLSKMTQWDMFDLINEAYQKGKFNIVMKGIGIIFDNY